MRANMIRLLLSGVLVLPVCVTGVVTAFQFQASREAIGNNASLSYPGDASIVGEGIADESLPATPIVPARTEEAAGSSEQAVSQDKVEPGEGPAAVPARRAPGPDATPETAKQKMPAQGANREYFAHLTVDGLLTGRLQYVDGRIRGLIPAKRVTISFVQHGRTISQAKPRVDGFFQAAGLVPGLYTVVASGLDGVLTFGIEIQSALNEANAKADGRVEDHVQLQIERERFRLRQTESENVRAAESFLQLDAVLVPPRDVSVVRGILESYVMPRRRPHSTRALSKTQAIKNAQRTLQMIRGANDRSTLDTTTQLVQAQTTIRGNSAKTIPGSWGTSLRMPIFYAHPDGSIAGRLTHFVPGVTNLDVHFRAPVAGGIVYFIRNGVVVERTRADEHGRFRIAGLPVGDYTFVSAGADGVAAFGVAVMPHFPDAAARAPRSPVRSASSIRLVQAQREAKGAGQGETDLSDHDVEVDSADPGDVGDLFGPFAEGERKYRVPGDGFVGSGGGGGGGGFAGGAGFGLLGLGGLAGLAALQDNNNGGGPIASPGTP
jgi:hypothetical protein